MFQELALIIVIAIVLEFTAKLVKIMNSSIYLGKIPHEPSLMMNKCNHIYKLNQRGYQFAGK